MNRKIIACIAISILIGTICITHANAQVISADSTELEILIEGRHDLWIALKNVGNNDAYNVNWDATITTFGIGGINVHDSKIIEILSIGDQTTVYPLYRMPSPSGFGILKIDLTFNADNVDITSVTIRGILIGKIVILPLRF